MENPFFLNREALIVTKHAKEHIIAPYLKQTGIVCKVSQDIDTDILGTFDGSVKRIKPALETVRAKCELGHSSAGSEIVIASEGSFGQHPFIWLSRYNEELVMLKDFKNNLEIIGRSGSSNTNFNSITTSSKTDLIEFAESAFFPRHALILKDQEKKPRRVVKNIHEWKELTTNFQLIKKEFGNVYVETDMRAMNNPLRRLVIRKAVGDLIKNISSTCPKCSYPGFVVRKVTGGLPCQACNNPTKAVLFHELGCDGCGNTTTIEFPNNKQFESPQFCDYCNP